MQCDKCQAPIPAGEEESIHGRTVCEECLMDILSPARTCDPWAVRSAQQTMATMADGVPQLTPRQERILALLAGSDGLAPDDLARQLGLKAQDVERELATLRHLEKVRGALVAGRKVFRPW
ncbi:MAG: MarR family transcriptional regulator [Thermodesulfobacteriota bacterium]